MGDSVSSYLDIKSEETWLLYHLLGIDVLQHKPIYGGSKDSSVTNLQLDHS